MPAIRHCGSTASSVAPWASVEATQVEGRTEYRAPLAGVTPVVDGVAGDPAWSAAPRHEIDQLWSGPEYAAADFRASHKVVWTPERIYMLVELVDDILLDRHRDPLLNYWDDDCLEIVIDEDFSGGDHQHNHNAFAYHVPLDNQVIDIGTARLPHSCQHGSLVTTLELLGAGQVIGLMAAYCDNDGSRFRENSVGCEAVPFGKKDRGWIDADLFGKLVLDAPR